MDKVQQCRRAWVVPRRVLQMAPSALSREDAEDAYFEAA